MDMIEPNTNKVILYLNLECIIKVIFTSDICDRLEELNDDINVKLSLISNIINLAQHYRWYFTKRGYDCHIYMYWNYRLGQYKNLKYNPSYRQYYNNRLFNNRGCKYLKDCFADIYKSLRIIVNYMNQVDMIDSSDIESSVIPYIIRERLYKDDRYTRHIIISIDKYDFQYVSYGFKVLAPKQINTEILDDVNIIPYLVNTMGLKTACNVPSNLIPFIISMLGCKYRNIPKIEGIGLGTLLKYIKSALDRVAITPNTTDIETLQNILKEEYRDRFISNYRCTNIAYQYNELTELDIHKILSQIEDRYDDNALDYINERYFIKYPLFNVKNHKEQIFNETENTKSIFDR